LATIVYAGNIDITTYYPVPYGEYNKLKTTGGVYFAGGNGDVCGATPTDPPNGEVNAVDAVAVTQYLMGTVSLSPDQYAAADVNGDCRVSKLDSELIFRAVMGLGTIDGAHTEGKYIANKALNVDYNGRVGIGVDTLEETAGQKLEVNGTAKAWGFTSSRPDNTGSYVHYILDRGSSADAYIGTVGDGEGSVSNMYFSVFGGPHMTITKQGKVGIGTNSPTGTLEVNSGAADTSPIIGISTPNKDDFLSIFGGRLNNQNPFIAWKRGPLRFGTATSFGGGDWSEKMRITHAGNVGIGTPAPTANLDVNGKIRGKAIYACSSDRSVYSSDLARTTGNRWTTEGALDVSLQVQTGDIVMVILAGNLRNLVVGQTSYMRAALFSGSAEVVMQPDWITVTTGQSGTWGGGSSAGIFKATEDGTLRFRGQFHSGPGGTAEHVYSTLIAYIIGKN
ncbi:MAG: dockerin type I repeat-containing protein, partial [Candidatus Omnitrophota bacterium]